MEDYKEKYEQALENIKAIKAANKDNKGLVDFIEFKYPELKESEDEKIRKALIHYFSEQDGILTAINGSVSVGNILAWLEKQDPKKHEEELERAYKCADEVQYRKGYEDAKREFEKQGEQKPNDKCEGCNNVKGCVTCTDGNQYAHITEQKPNDKVEPKFKAGNWYICVKDFIGKGVRFDKGHTYYCGLDGCLQEFDSGAHIAIYEIFYNYFKLWTIQDAKSGDIIFSNDDHGSDSIELIKSIYDKRIDFWFCLSSKNNFKDCHYEVYNGDIPYTNFASRKKATPTTKEQRDLLFQKIKEAGYEWNSEKKELKKIDARENLVLDGDLMQADCMMIEQKSLWSEEDKEIIDLLIAIFEVNYPNEFYKTTPANDPNIKGKHSLEIINWLKYLKERLKGE